MRTDCIFICRRNFFRPLREMIYSSGKPQIEEVGRERNIRE